MNIIQGTITSRFGGRRDPLNSQLTIHQGIDIAAPFGTPIFSPDDATVAGIYEHLQGGLTLILRNSTSNIRYGMCHLSTVEVEIGQSVNKGQLVARSGNSGRTTGPHLHYSVKTGGVWRGTQYVGGRFVDSSQYIDI